MGFVALLVCGFALLCSKAIKIPNVDFYVSFFVLLSLYAMLSQIWLPIALNFSIGLYFVTLTAIMLNVVKRKAQMATDLNARKIESNIDKKMEAKRINNEQKEQLLEAEEDEQTMESVVFMPYSGMKERLFRLMLLFGIGIGAVYVILIIMDMDDLFWLLDNLKYDLLNEPISNKHPAWIVFFVTILPTYFGSFLLLLSC